jgi:hypothetical protein
MIRVSSVRFFLTVSPAPVWMRAAFAAAVAIGIGTLWLNPAEVDAALGSILLLQMFSASNGYSASSARGHFDPILVSGRPRLSIAAANLLAAALPGVVAWLAIVVVALALGHSPRAAAPHRQMALVTVSCAAWAAGLTLPRMAAGALWSVVLVALAMSRGMFADALLVAQAVPTGLGQVAAAAAACSICPFLLLGELPGATDARVLTLDGAAAIMVALVGVRHVCRREYGLVEPA